MKVLVVEDDKKLSIAICTRLQSYGYQAVTAHDAISAISVAINHNPDLALVDINLPGGDGFTVLNRLNASAECGTMPTIMMTANRDDSLEDKARQHGVSAFLQKPFGSTVLLDAIQSTMEGFPAEALQEH